LPSPATEATLSPPAQRPAVAPAPTPVALVPEPPAPSPGVDREPEPEIARSEAPGLRMGAGPCLPPPPADGVIPWEALSPFEAWEQLLGRIREDDEFLAAMLGHVGLASLGAGVLRVAAPRGSFAHTELLRNPQRRAQVDQATRDHFGASFALELVEGEPSLPELPSLALVVEQRRAEHRARVEAEAKAHPGIQSLLRLFDGQLVGTRPLHEP
jgi:DNA polymerase III subunit gamma/tau